MCLGMARVGVCVSERDVCVQSVCVCALDGCYK